MSPSPHDLGSRASDVFERLLSDRGDSLHPEDRAEAEAFNEWLGGFERPKIAVEDRPLRSRRPMVATIAALVALAACLLIAINVSTTGFWQKENSAVERYATNRAERQTIKLSDGSIVKLGGNSGVEVTFSKQARRVRLTSGEALFEVAHNRNRPFIVQVPHGEILAVGTAFNVRVEPTAVRVTVVEGVIRVAVPSRPGVKAEKDAITRTARKGEQLSFGARKDRESVIGFIRDEPKVDVAMTTAWTHGLLYFNGEPLSQVIETVNRYSRDKVVLNNPKLASMPIFGTLNEGDTRALRELIDQPDGIRITSEE